jgi:hypothetical protein
VDVSPVVDTSAPQQPRRVGPALVTLLVVVCLLGVVAVAAGGDTSLGSAGTRRPSHLLLDTLVSLYLVLMACGAVLFVWLLVLRKDSPQERARLQREGRIRSLVIVALLLGVLGVGLRLAERRNDGGTRPGDGTAGSARPKPLPESKGYEPSFATIPVLVVLGLAGGGIAAFALAARARRRELDPFPHVDLAEALEDALADTLDDLRAERDPRRAVIAAYARLERTLAAFGLPRRPAEAPAEYLERILAQLEVSHGLIARLTALFERAKFSQHEVDPGMKEEAIDALQRTRDELREARERELAERAAALAEARERAATA